MGVAADEGAPSETLNAGPRLRAAMTLSRRVETGRERLGHIRIETKKAADVVVSAASYFGPAVPSPLAGEG